MRRLRLGEWLVLTGVLGSSATLFLRWYGAAVTDSDGIHTAGFTALGWPVVALLLISIALGLALVLTTLVERSPAVPVGISVVTWIVGAIAFCVLLLRVIIEPGLGLGLASSQVDLRWPGYVGLLAAALIPAGAFRALRDERTDSPVAGYDPPPARPVPDLPAGEAGSPGEAP